MAYFLHHLFDPDFDYQNLSPTMLAGGSVDHRKLNYVQNVREGDVIARWEAIPAGEERNYDPRFIHDHKTFPLGRNCQIHPENPDILCAGATGYVFYLDGTINVKRVLNIRGDLDYHTGNIRFVNDIIIHGTVRSGFEVRAENIRVYENVNGATLLANKSLQVDGGIKGSKKADIRAKANVRVGFCENAVISSGRDILVDGTCYHCDLRACRHIVIKGRFQGGTLYSPGTVIVHERAGCGLGGKSCFVLGFNPLLLREADAIGIRLTDIATRLDQGEEHHEDKAEAREKELTRDQAALMERQHKVWQAVAASFSPAAQLVVPGEILAGADISIGPASYRVEEPMRDVRFFLKDNEICHVSPAIDT